LAGELVEVLLEGALKDASNEDRYLRARAGAQLVGMALAKFTRGDDG
jgi:hypothetical protein